ncbi:MAG: HPr kinase/phosphorylase [Sphingomonadaceae bacterium]
MADIIEHRLHATCVAIGDQAILIRGQSGSGKSDLALRLIDRGAVLVSDDYTAIRIKNGVLVAAAPATIKGKFEVYGLGIIECATRDNVPLAMLIDVDQPVERMPQDGQVTMILGIALPRFAILPFEASAPIKVERALASIGGI